MKVRISAQTQTANNVTLNDQADGNGKKDRLVLDKTMNLQAGSLKNMPLPAAIGNFTLYLDNNSMDDLWLAVSWGK